MMQYLSSPPFKAVLNNPPFNGHTSPIVLLCHGGDCIGRSEVVLRTAFLFGVKRKKGLDKLKSLSFALAGKVEILPLSGLCNKFINFG